MYRFHDLNDPIPDASERRLVAQGSVLHVSLEPRYFGDPSKRVTWSQIADGRYDQELRRQATGIASLRVPVFVTFAHEPDQHAKRRLGTASDFVAAWRHVHALYAQAGASNAVWVWVVMGWPPAFALDGAMWPGNDVVDWISWEAYNGAGCGEGRVHPQWYRSFASSMLPFYRWVHREGSRFGIDATKPMMISEAGSVLYPGAAQRTASWYAGIPATLRRYPQVKAISFWDSIAGRCDFRFQADPIVLSALSAAMPAVPEEPPSFIDSRAP